MRAKIGPPIHEYKNDVSQFANRLRRNIGGNLGRRNGMKIRYLYHLRMILGQGSPGRAPGSPKRAPDKPKMGPRQAQQKPKKGPETPKTAQQRPRQAQQSHGGCSRSFCFGLPFAIEAILRPFWCISLLSWGYLSRNWMSLRTKLRLAGTRRSS